MKNLSFLTIILLSILIIGMFSCKSEENKQNEEVKISKLNAENEKWIKHENYKWEKQQKDKANNIAL